MHLHRAQPLGRRVALAMLVAAFLSVALFATAQTIQVHRDLEAREAARVSEELSSLIRLWETTSMGRVNTWLVDLSDAEDTERQEMYHRRADPAFLGYFSWEPSADGVLFVHPPLPVEEDVPLLMEDACLARAAELSITAPHDDVARAYEACTALPLPGRLLTASRAADLYLADGQPQQAWDVLNAVPVALTIPLSDAERAGLPVYRVAVRRLQAAEASGGLGEVRRQRALLTRTGREICDLGGRSLELLLPYVTFPVIADLRAMSEDDGALELNHLLYDAQLRLNGYVEIRDRVAAAQPDSESSTRIELVHVQYGAEPFVIAMAANPRDGRTSAVQLTQAGLLTALQRMARPELREHLFVEDADGRPIIAPDDEKWVVVPFQRLFPHLRLGVSHAIDHSEDERKRQLIGQLGPLAVTLLLGLVALAGLVRSERTQRRLIERQRAFMARVTHELKTPLAGIRVMAETLEMTVGNEGTTPFVDRILQEADRLGDRIDEVLRVAREVEEPTMAAVDPQQLIEKAEEAWSPRFEQLGGQLAVAVRDSATVQADVDLLSDALGNLLDNALKYRREDRAPRCEVELSTSGNWVVIDVRDNGVGVPSSYRRTIFEPFARIEDAGRGKAGGHGLGLAFVAETVRIHGGRIECRDGIDGGARFTLRLKRSSEQ